jgi:hypothetical protein
MNEVLKIEVQADVQRAVNGLKTLQSELGKSDKAFQETANKSIAVLNNQLERLQRIASNTNLSTAQYERLGKIISKTKGDITSLTSSIQVLNSASGKLGNGTNQATFALTNFSRVVQDAPFGIIGIANNIDPLLQSFTALKASTGSTGAALKALAGSLIGGGGLALAVSAVTSAFTFFALSQRGANKELNEAKSTTDGYVRNLTEQKLELQSLVNIVKDAAQSEQTRTKALERLNQILPDSIGKLTQQNIVTAEGINIIRQYVKAIEARATAELLVNRLAENNVKLFDNRSKTLKANADLESRIVQLREKAERLRAKGQFEFAFTVEAEISAALSEQNKARLEGRTLANQILTENETIRAEYERQLPLSIQLNKSETTRAQKTKEVTAEVVKQSAEIKAIIERVQTSGLGINDAVPNFDKLIAKQKEFVASGLPEKANRTSSLTLTPEQWEKQFEYFDELAKKQQRQNELTQLGANIAQGWANAFVDVFSTINKEGETTFGRLAKAIEETTKRILIQYAVTKAFTLLLNTIAPGVGTAFGQTQQIQGVLRGDTFRLALGRP